MKAAIETNKQKIHSRLTINYRLASKQQQWEQNNQNGYTKVKNFYHIFSNEWHSNAMFNHADVVTLLNFFFFHFCLLSFSYRIFLARYSMCWCVIFCLSKMFICIFYSISLSGKCFKVVSLFYKTTIAVYTYTLWTQTETK